MDGPLTPRLEGSELACACLGSGRRRPCLLQSRARQHSTYECCGDEYSWPTVTLTQAPVTLTAPLIRLVKA